MKRWWLGLMLSMIGCGGFDPTVDGGTGKSCVVANTRCEDGLTADGCRMLSDTTHDDVIYRESQSCADLGYSMSCGGKPGKYKTCS